MNEDQAFCEELEATLKSAGFEVTAEKKEVLETALTNSECAGFTKWDALDSFRSVILLRFDVDDAQETMNQLMAVIPKKCHNRKDERRKNPKKQHLATIGPTQYRILSGFDAHKGRRRLPFRHRKQ